MKESGNNTPWVPEIHYEEADDGMTSNIPFISVPDGQDMPLLLYIFESRETGEFEPGPEGEELPVTEIDLHQYADMAALKEKMSYDEYNNVRLALGLETLASATEKGKAISSNIRQNLGADIKP